MVICSAVDATRRPPPGTPSARICVAATNPRPHPPLRPHTRRPASCPAPPHIADLPSPHTPARSASLRSPIATASAPRPLTRPFLPVRRRPLSMLGPFTPYVYWGWCYHSPLRTLSPDTLDTRVLVARSSKRPVRGGHECARCLSGSGLGALPSHLSPPSLRTPPPALHVIRCELLQLVTC